MSTRVRLVIVMASIAWVGIVTEVPADQLRGFSIPLIDLADQTDRQVVVDREEGASSFRRLDSTELSQWISDYSLGELWQKNIFSGSPVHE